MAHLINQIKWKDFQFNPDLLHEAVLKWQEDQVQDPVILGLIERYHFYHGDANLVVQEMMNTKEIIIRSKEVPLKRNWKSYAAAACAIVLIGVCGWWLKHGHLKRSWSFQDEGIPQFMGQEVSTIDWAGVNYNFKNGDFDKCLGLLSDARLKYAENDTLMYYSGYCFLQLNERDSALKYFSKVPPMGSVYSWKAKYFIFHLDAHGPNFDSLRGLLNIQDPILQEAVKKDISK